MSAKTKKDLSGKIEEILEAMSDASSKHNLSKVIDPLKENMEEILESVKDLPDNLSDLKKVATDKAKDAFGKVKDYAEEHPVAAISIAAGVGFLLARLFSGKR